MLGKGSSVRPDSPLGRGRLIRPKAAAAVVGRCLHRPPWAADSGGETGERKRCAPVGARIEIARARPSGWGQRSRRGLLPAPPSPSEGGFPTWSVPVLPRPAPPGSPCPVRWCGGGGGVGCSLGLPGGRGGRWQRGLPSRCGAGWVWPRSLLGVAGAAQPVISISRSGAAALAAPARRGLCPPRFGAGSPPQSSVAGSAAPRPAALPLRGARPACGAGLVRRVAHLVPGRQG